MRRLWWIVGLCALLCAAPTTARPKTDIIVLINGDTITGEVKGLRAGKLEVSTDHMGTVNIEWDKITSLTSDYNFEVRISSGERLYGLLESPGDGQSMNVKDIYGSEQLVWLDVVELRPLQKTIKDALDVYLSAGFDYTKATDVAQAKFTTTITYENERSRNSLDARTTISDTSGVDSASSRVDATRRVFVSRAKTYGNYSATYEQNDQLALDGRFALGGGIGRYIVDNNRMQLVSSIGAQVITERDKNDQHEESAELMLNLEFNAWRYDEPELDVRYILNLYPSLTEDNRMRADSELRFRWEIFHDLFFDISGWITYDNRNPTDSQTDYAITTGIGWEY